MVALGGSAFSYERGSPEERAFTRQDRRGGARNAAAFVFGLEQVSTNERAALEACRILLIKSDSLPFGATRARDASPVSPDRASFYQAERSRGCSRCHRLGMRSPGVVMALHGVLATTAYRVTPLVYPSSGEGVIFDPPQVPPEAWVGEDVALPGRSSIYGTARCPATGAPHF